MDTARRFAPVAAVPSSPPAGGARHALIAAVCAGALIAQSLPALAIDTTWTNTGTSDWFDPANWTGGIPNDLNANAFSVFINNGGTASADSSTSFYPGSGATAGGFYLDLGVGSVAGTHSGTLETSNVGVNFRIATDVGVATGAADGVYGALTTTGASAATAHLQVGVVSGSTAAAPTATGTLAIGGLLDGSAGNGTFGATILNANAGIATGTATVANGAAFGNLIVGTNLNGGAATGSVTVNSGDLQVSGSTLSVGTNNGAGSANGTIDVTAGILRFGGFSFEPTITIGQAYGGIGVGSVDAAGIDTTVQAARKVAIGVGDAGGTAQGRLSVLAGDLNLVSGTVASNVDVGVHNVNAGGSSIGLLDLGGSLRGGGGGSFGDPRADLNIGVTRTLGFSGNGAGSADGTVRAAGVGEFNAIGVGVSDVSTPDTTAVTASARGRLEVGAGGIAGILADTLSQASELLVGVIRGLAVNGGVTGVGGTAEGTAIVSGGDVTNIQRGITVGASNGDGTASGALSVQNANVAAGSLMVGSAALNAASRAGATPQATGSFTQTNGLLELGQIGSISNTGSLNVGFAFGAKAKGTVNLENVDARVGSMFVGLGTTSFFGSGVGEAQGTVIANGGSLSVIGGVVIASAVPGSKAMGEVRLADTRFLAGDALSVGNGAGEGLFQQLRGAGTAGSLSVGTKYSQGPGEGVFMLTDTAFTVLGDAAVGTGPFGNGALHLVHSTLSVGSNMDLGSSWNAGALLGAADVTMNPSFINVEGSLTFYAGAHLTMGIDGLARKDGYSAIDADNAFLDGLLDIVFGFTPGAGAWDFDLIMADLTDGVGIEGDFAGVSVRGLNAGFAASTGIVNQSINGVDFQIYRLTIRGEQVPAPATLALLGIGLAGLGFARRRKAQ